MLPLIATSWFKEIREKTGNNTCGPISICSVLESMSLSYNASKIVNDCNIHNGGSALFGTALGLAKNCDLKIDIYIDRDIDKIENELNKIEDDFEKLNFKELRSFENVKMHTKISIEQILEKIDKNSYPILSFYINGDRSGAHFSPLLGIDDKNILYFAFNSNGEPILVYKNEFINDWWFEKHCIIVSKQKFSFGYLFRHLFSYLKHY
jgi:hypothetical protein